MKSNQPSEGMRRIHWTLNIGIVGCEQQGWFDIESDASDEEIEEAARDEAFQHIDWNWRKKEGE